MRTDDPTNEATSNGRPMLVRSPVLVRSELSGTLALLNKPMVPTATHQTDDDSVGPLRRHIGRPLCSHDKRRRNGEGDGL